MTEIVFSLTSKELSPIVQQAIGEPVTSLSACIEHQLQGHKGYAADKIIPTFSFTTASARTGALDIFIKWHRTPGPREAHHYAFLEKMKAPIPRLYGSLVKEGREMLFLEYLRPVGGLKEYDTFLDDPERFLKFLSTLARFNAIQPPAGMMPQLEQNHSDPTWWWHTALSALEHVWQQADKGNLGEEIRRVCFASPSLQTKLQNLVWSLRDQVKVLPKGLVHSDFGPDQVGWREDEGVLLILDLEQLGYLPRFTDVGPWIGRPEDTQQYCLPRIELARHYLEEYARWGGQPVPIDQFLLECRIAWLCEELTMLFFSLDRSLDGHVDWTSNLEEGRRAFRKDLLVSLRDLARQVQ